MESLPPVHYAPDGSTTLCGDESTDAVVAVLPELSAEPARMAEKGDTPGTRYGA